MTVKEFLLKEKQLYFFELYCKKNKYDKRTKNNILYSYDFEAIIFDITMYDRYINQLKTKKSLILFLMENDCLGEFIYEIHNHQIIRTIYNNIFKIDLALLHYGFAHSNTYLNIDYWRNLQKLGRDYFKVKRP